MCSEFENRRCLIYFQEALALLEEYQWVFNFPVTHMLVLNVLNEIPVKWKNVISCMNTEDLNSLPLGGVKVSIRTLNAQYYLFIIMRNRLTSHNT